MGLSACSWHHLKCDKKRDQTTQKEINSPTDSVAMPSELTLLMRRMVNDLMQEREGLIKGSPKVVYKDYASITSAKMAEGIPDNIHFDEQANALLYRFVEFDARRNVLAYNNIINACIKCHEDMNPRPIERINKLYLYQ